MIDADILYVVLTIDADCDFFDSSMRADWEASKLQWNGIEFGVPLMLNVFRGYQDSFGNSVKLTWFVRVDNQLAMLYGDAGYILGRFKKFWHERINHGDEIAFHPHLYRIEGGRWRQETRGGYLDIDIRQSYKAMQQKGFIPVSSRIGEAYHSTPIMLLLNELGIKVDSTAMPGRIRKDGERNLDWEITPNHPYHPSRDDYRQPGSDALDILEVPMSMIYMKTEYDQQPLKRYVDLSFHHALMRNGLSAHVRDKTLLVTVTHPSCVLPQVAKKRHGLISFDIAEMKKNLDFIISECERFHKKYQFIMIQDCLSLFRMEK